ncbi:hypothetical protein Ccrd_001074 [Cynara cardunculus var. scolymus]|uniref:Uncharacterized protein n=1 Tax=Cynara cardunculus var. scolymus TaxID=59895 RepID=A0A124SDF5_CYNCS|nr:hypothetical protein Ccrd_001074 [Cynara cardunculus var. scolymus]
MAAANIKERKAVGCLVGNKEGSQWWLDLVAFCFLFSDGSVGRREHEDGAVSSDDHLQQIWMKTEALQQRRKDGLCFRCPEKFFPGHKCSPPQFLIIVDNDDQQSLSDPNDTTPPEATPPSQLWSLSAAAYFGMCVRFIVIRLMACPISELVAQQNHSLHPIYLNRSSSSLTLSSDFFFIAGSDSGVGWCKCDLIGSDIALVVPYSCDLTASEIVLIALVKPSETLAGDTNNGVEGILPTDNSKYIFEGARLSCRHLMDHSPSHPRPIEHDHSVTTIKTIGKQTGLQNIEIKDDNKNYYPNISCVPFIPSGARTTQEQKKVRRLLFVVVDRSKTVMLFVVDRSIANSEGEGRVDRSFVVHRYRDTSIVVRPEETGVVKL